MIANKLHPLTGLALLNVFYKAQDAQAVWSSIDKVTDLDDDHVVWQEERLASRARFGQRLPELIKVPAGIPDNDDLAHVSLRSASTCRLAYCGSAPPTRLSFGSWHLLAISGR